MTDQAVKHDEKGKRFVMEVEGREALLSYSQEGDTLDFYRTFVPEELRGQGLAEKVVKAAFEYAREKGFKVQPSCSYVSGAFLKRHKEYQDLVVP